MKRGARVFRGLMGEDSSSTIGSFLDPPSLENDATVLRWREGVGWEAPSISTVRSISPRLIVGGGSAGFLRRGWDPDACAVV